MNNNTNNAYECTGDLLEKEFILQRLFENDPDVLAGFEQVLREPLAAVERETEDVRKAVMRQWRTVVVNRALQTEPGDAAAEMADMENMVVLQHFIGELETHGQTYDVMNCAGAVALSPFLLVVVFRLFWVEENNGAMHRRSAADKFKGGGWRETDLHDDEWTRGISEGLSDPGLSTINWAVRILGEAGIISQCKVPDPVTGRKTLYIRLHSDRLLLLFKLARELLEARVKVVEPILQSFLTKGN